MKGKFVIIICFTAFLFLLAVFGGKMEPVREDPPLLSALVLSEGNAEQISLWKDPSGEYYLFLPAYAELSQVQIRSHTGKPVYIEGKLVTEGMNCSAFPLNEPLEIRYDPSTGYSGDVLTILQSANLPAMYIDVASGNMEYIHAQKGNKESGVMRLYSADGQLDSVAQVEAIQGRGNSTWPWRDKKPYSLRLYPETDLLDMGRAQKWVLLADAFDLSLLKNKITYDLARDAGMAYTPDCQWVDLYLNGTFAGMYLLSERNMIHPQRVDIPAESSFLVSWESESRLIAQEYPYVKTEHGTAIRVHQSGLPLEEVQRIWQSAENAIFAEDGLDPVTGKHWQDLIDLDSWAKLFLIDEISADHDGGSISKFFYYDQSNGTGKIFAGPVWDKDDSFGTGHWTVTPPNCLVAGRSYLQNGQEQRIFAGLSGKEEFLSCVAEVYQNTFLPLLNELYDTGITEYAGWISQAALLHETRWGLGYTPESSLNVRNFLGDRMAFLNTYWIEKETFCHVKLYDSREGSLGEFAIRPGEYLPDVPHYDGSDWFLAGTQTSFDVQQPIYEDVSIILRPVDDGVLETPAGEEADDHAVSGIKETGIFLTIVAGVFVLSAVDLWRNKRFLKNDR